MSIITKPYSEADGQIAFASSINKEIDLLYTLQNGNINNDNLNIVDVIMALRVLS